MDNLCSSFQALAHDWVLSNNGVNHETNLRHSRPGVLNPFRDAHELFHVVEKLDQFLVRASRASRGDGVVHRAQLADFRANAHVALEHVERRQPMGRVVPYSVKLGMHGELGSVWTTQLRHPVIKIGS